MPKFLITAKTLKSLICIKRRQTRQRKLSSAANGYKFLSSTERLTEQWKTHHLQQSSRLRLPTCCKRCHDVPKSNYHSFTTDTTKSSNNFLKKQNRPLLHGVIKNKRNKQLKLSKRISKKQNWFSNIVRPIDLPRNVLKSVSLQPSSPRFKGKFIRQKPKKEKLLQTEEGEKVGSKTGRADVTAIKDLTDNSGGAGKYIRQETAISVTNSPTVFSK